MLQSKNEHLVREHFERFWNQRQVQKLEECFIPEFELIVGEETLRGVHAYQNAARSLLKAFPDMRFNIDDLFAVEDRVTLRWTATGTHLGTFMGIEPTGRQISYWGISIYEIQNNQIARQWGSADLYVLLANLHGEKPQIPFLKAA